MCGSVDVRQAVLAKNDDLAAALRAEFTHRGLTVVNLLSSPGSGKTALLELLLRRARERGLAPAALTADLATENDARRLARSKAPVKQVLTGGLCHLEAAQLRAHIEGWLPDEARILFVENVGNLVCPAGYDLGESLRIALMSVTEGEDKPAKYPTAFGLANLVVLTKTDLAAAVGFAEAEFTAQVHRVNPGVEVLHTSARAERGVEALLDRVVAVHGGAVPHRPLLAADHPGHHHGPDGGHTGEHTHRSADAHPHGHPPRDTLAAYAPTAPEHTHGDAGHDHRHGPTRDDAAARAPLSG